MLTFLSKNCKVCLLLTGIILLISCSQPKKLDILLAGSKVLAFGDSLTYGTGADKDHSYPAALEKLIQLEVINAGIPGEFSSEGLARLPKLLAEHQPELLILCHGGNDILRKNSPQQLKQNLIDMIELAQQNNTQVVLIGVPQLKVFGGVHPVYQQVAEQYKLPFESEALASLLKNNQYKSDMVHLNNAGYQQFAEHIYQLLQEEGALYQFAYKSEHSTE